MVIRHWEETDSLEELTGLRHRAYARLGAMGLNYAAVDQPVEVTAQRIGEGTCFVALLRATEEVARAESYAYLALDTA